MIAENEPVGGRPEEAGTSRPEEAAGGQDGFAVHVSVYDASGEVRLFRHEVAASSWHFETTESGERVFRFREAKP